MGSEAAFLSERGRRHGGHSDLPARGAQVPHAPSRCPRGWLWIQSGPDHPCTASGRTGDAIATAHRTACLRKSRISDRAGGCASWPLRVRPYRPEGRVAVRVHWSAFTAFWRATRDSADAYVAASSEVVVTVVNRDRDDSGAAEGPQKRKRPGSLSQGAFDLKPPQCRYNQRDTDVAPPRFAAQTKTKGIPRRGSSECAESVHRAIGHPDGDLGNSNIWSDAMRRA